MTSFADTKTHLEKLHNITTRQDIIITYGPFLVYQQYTHGVGISNLSDLICIFDELKLKIQTENSLTQNDICTNICSHLVASEGGGVASSRIDRIPPHSDYIALCRSFKDNRRVRSVYTIYFMIRELTGLQFECFKFHSPARRLKFVSNQHGHPARRTHGQCLQVMLTKLKTIAHILYSRTVALWNAAHYA